MAKRKETSDTQMNIEIPSFRINIKHIFGFLCLVGIILIYRRRSPLLFLLIPLIYTAFIYMPLSSFENRYSQPVYPFVLLYAGIAFSMIFKKNSSKIIN